MLDGTVIEYLEDGQKTSVSNYKNGKRQGKSISYYKNGSLYIEANYINNELDGDIKVYKKNGDLDYIAPYKNGKPLTAKKLKVSDDMVDEISQDLREILGDDIKITVKEENTLEDENKFSN